MNQKKLEFSLKLDTAEFDKAVEKIQAKINRITAPQEQMAAQTATSRRLEKSGLGGLSPASQEAYKKHTQQSKRDFDQMIMAQIQGQEKLGKVISQREQLLNKLKLKEKESITDAEKLLKIKETMSRVEENNFRLRESYKQRDAALNQMLDLKNEKKPTRSAQETISGISSFAGIGGTAAAIIAGIGKIVGNVGKLPVEAIQAQGSASQALVGDQLKDLTSAYGQAFVPERHKAMAMAQKAWKTTRMQDQSEQVASNIALGIAGAGLLSAAGIALTVGTAGLAIPVGVLASVGLGGIAGKFGSSKQTALTTRNKGAYEQLSAADLSKYYKASEKGLEESDPLKKLAAEYNAQNYQRNLGIERNLGLTDQGFMGSQGFLRRNMAYGGRNQFTEEEVTQAQQAILQAGGSARMGREAGFGLQLEKNIGLTNAPQILAQLSKTAGGAGGTQQNLKGILTEAFKQGLDDSQLVDLLRGFTQTTADYVERSGAKSAEDVARIAATFGKGLTEQTGAGLAGAKTAYEAYQQYTGQQSGPFSILRRAGMMRNPLLKSLKNKGEMGAATFEKLVQTPEEQLTEDNPAVMFAAQSAGGKTTPQDIIAAVQSVNRNSTNRSKSFYDARDKVNAYQQKYGKITRDNINSIPPDIRTAAETVGILGTTRGISAFGDMTKTQDIYSTMQTQLSPVQEYGPGTAGAAVGTAITPGADTGRSADQVNANLSAAQQVLIENFEKLKNQVVPVANDIDLLTKQLILLGAVSKDIANGKSGKDAYSKAVAEIAKTQPQGSSPVPSGH